MQTVPHKTRFACAPYDSVFAAAPQFPALLKPRQPSAPGSITRAYASAQRVFLLADTPVEPQKSPQNLWFQYRHVVAQVLGALLLSARQYKIQPVATEFRRGPVRLFSL